VANFTDPMVDCRQCKARYRVDVLLEELSLKKKKEILRTLDPAAFAGQLQDQTVIDEFTRRVSADDVIANVIQTMVTCPNCGNKNTFTEAANST